MLRKKSFRPSMLALKIIYNLFVSKKGITVKELSSNTRTDYKNTHGAVNALFNTGLIKKEKIGNYNLCSLNYSNEDIIEYLKEYNFYIKTKEFRSKYPVEYQIITKTCEDLKYQIGPFFICLIFGSFAKDEGKNGSDIDILFLTEFSKAEAFIKKVLNKINAPYQKKFHLIEQNIMNFIKDLKAKDKLSLATEIYKEPPILFYGDDIFFRMVANGNIK